MLHKNKIGFGIISLALVISPIVSAEKTYTKDQLVEMAASGNYPAQGSPSAQTQKMSFTECVGKVTNTVDSVSPNYPAEVIVNTSTMYLAKIWTNDAAMTLTCSMPDGQMTITKAAYK